jgi:HK97 family phage major capsid protein
MLNLDELLDERRHKIKTADDIIHKAEQESRTTTEEEQKAVEELFDEVKVLDKQIGDAERHEELRKKVATQTARLAKMPTKPNLPIAFSNDGQPEARDHVPVQVRPRYGKLVAFKGPNAEERAYRCGEWFRATFLNNEKAKRFCRNHGMELRTVLAEGTGSIGGNLVPPAEFEQTIIDLREEYGVARQNCTIIPMGRDMVTIPRLSTGTSAAFIAENASVTESNPTWDNVQMTAKKLAILTRMSTELAEDSAISLAEFLAMDMAKAFALKEDQCLFIGDGTPTYGNIYGLYNVLTNASGLAGVAEAQGGNDDFIDLDATDLATILATSPEFARPNGKWFCSAACFGIVFERLAAAAGGNTIQTLSGAFAPAYLGYPIVISQVAPADLTVGATYNNLPMLYFGDLKMAAVLGDRRQLTVALSSERYFDVDQIAIRATERFDLNIHGYGTTSDAGAICSLIGTT